MHRREEKRETVAIEGYELPEVTAPRKKTEKETIETEIPKEMKPHFNVVGSIDLENLNKRKTEPKKEEKPEEPLTETEKVPEDEPTFRPAEKAEEPQPVEAAPVVPEPVKEIPAPVVEEQVKEEVPARVEEVIAPSADVEKEVMKEEATVTADTGESQAAPAEKVREVVAEEAGDVAAEEVKPEGTRSDKVFRLHKNKLESNIVVKGSIDLDAINDRTRPPRKSRAQRKKERLDREQQALDGKKLKEEKVKLLKKEAIDEKKKKRTRPMQMTTARRKKDAHPHQ